MDGSSHVSHFGLSFICVSIHSIQTWHFSTAADKDNYINASIINDTLELDFQDGCKTH